MGIQKRESQREQPSQTKNQGRKDGPQHQHLLSFLLQQQMERRLDGPQQEPRQPVQGVQELVQQGGGQGGGGQHQDGGQDRRLRVQAGGVEGLRAIRKTSRGRKARGEEGGRQRLYPEELLKELHPAQGGGG